MSAVGPGLGVVWALLVGGLFALRYPEASRGFSAVGAWGQRGGEAAVAGLVLLAAATAGRAFLRRAGAAPAHPAAAWAWSTALGLGGLALTVFALGLAGWTHPLVYVGLMAACVAAGRAELVGLRADLRRIGSGTWSAARLAWLAIFAFPLWLGFLMAAAPPTGYDALVYHLGFPSVYLAEGRIVPLRWSVHGGFPQVGEMLYLLAWRLGGTGAAGLLHGAAYGLTGLGLYGLVASRWGALAGRWAAALWLWTPAAGLLAGTGSVDLFVALFVLTAGALLLEDHPGLAGMAAGLAVGAKYTALLPLAAMLFTLMVARPQRFAGRFGLAAALTMSPWLVRNILWYGNPVHPLLPHLFPAATEPLRQAAARYTEHVGGHGDMRGVWDWVRLPWLMVFDGVRFGGGFDQWGPWPLLAPVGLLLTRARDNIVACVAICVLAVLVGWGATARVLRLLIPVLPFIAMLAVQPLAPRPPAPPATPGGGCLAGFGGESSAALPSAWFRLALMAAMLSGAAIWGFALGFVDPGPVVAGAESPQAFLRRKLGDLVLISDAVNRLVPSGGRVLWVGEPRHGLTVPRRAAPTLFDDASPSGIYTHAVVKMSPPWPARHPASGGSPSGIEGRTIDVAGPYRLIELRPGAAGR